MCSVQYRKMRTPCFILILALLGLAHSFSLPKRPAHSFSPFSSARSYLFPDLKGYPTDIMLNILYGGTYESMQVFPLFDYLTSSTGTIDAYFCNNDERRGDSVKNVEIFLFNPVYHDGKAIGMLLDLDDNPGSVWHKENSKMRIVKFWKERSDDEEQIQGVNYTITAINTQSSDQEQVTVQIQISGSNFHFKSTLNYKSMVIPTLMYCIFTTGIVSLIILGSLHVLRSIEHGNPGLVSKLSLMALCICNIEDFNLAMNHIEYVVSGSSGYLLYIFPSIAWILLFVIFDMKMLFVVWRSHNARALQNPQNLRKKLTAFYIQFYVGMFFYLTMSYFFTYDTWFIIIQHLFFVPQIIHNVRAGNNPGFMPSYIFVYFGLRIMLPLYQRGCPSNRFLLTPDLGIVVGLLLMYAGQILILYLQSLLGSRFFVPKIFLPNYFNYNCKLKLDPTNNEIECTICLQNLFSLDPTSNSLNDSLNMSTELIQEIEAMKTPCNHIFHKECLMEWMNVKLECPTCRSPLPGL